MPGDGRVYLEVVSEGLDRAEMIVTCREYEGAAQFFCALRPGDV